MGAQYTPGPWVICEDDELDSLPYIPIETDRPTGPDLFLICEVGGELDEECGEFVITERNRADARLIAAAPELLQAAQDGLHEVEAAIRCLTSQRTRDDMQKVADGMRAAISRALGEGEKA